MVGNKLEQSIISLFLKDLSATHSINGVAKSLKKAYPYIHTKVHALIEQQILKKIVIGKSYQCYINLHNEYARLLASMHELNRRENYLSTHSDIVPLMREIQQMYASIPQSVVVLSDRTVFVIVEDVAHQDLLNMKHPALKSFKIEYMNAKLFSEYYTNTPSLQEDHVVLLNANTFVSILESIVDTLLMKGILK